jgi:hypothetical protein
MPVGPIARGRIHGTVDYARSADGSPAKAAKREGQCISDNEQKSEAGLRGRDFVKCPAGCIRG